MTKRVDSGKNSRKAPITNQSRSLIDKGQSSWSSSRTRPEIWQHTTNDYIDDAVDFEATSFTQEDKTIKQLTTKKKKKKKEKIRNIKQTVFPSIKYDACGEMLHESMLIVIANYQTLSQKVKFSNI